MSGAGTFVAFAAGEGRSADDNPRDRNGLFTKHLLAALRAPGLVSDEVFNRVRLRVNQEAGGRQTPFSYSGGLGQFYFRSGALAPVVATVAGGDAAFEA